MSVAAALAVACSGAARASRGIVAASATDAALVAPGITTTTRTTGTTTGGAGCGGETD
ncbi:MAG: hypothetical protein ACTHOH_06500 [Lysobacteraceae bacterium]